MVVDANVLVYATNLDARHHDASRGWLESALSGSGPVILPWASLIAFIRVSTNRAAFTDPYTIEEACDYVEEWMRSPATQVVEPGRGHARRIRELLEPMGTGGNLTGDAHLAAIALELGMPVVSFDTDFDRFPGVDRIQPSLD